jgi:hypothetical protein
VSRRAFARAALFAALLSLGPVGCAYSLVSGGAIRPEPFEDLLLKTSRARGIEPARPVDARVVAQAESRAIVASVISQEWSEDELARYQDALSAVALWPPERDLLQETLAVHAAEVAGFYNPRERVFYLVEDAPIPFSVRLLSALARRDLTREIVVSHELVHLLQHQRYPALFEAVNFHAQDDAAWATSAALEGDAVRFGFEALGILPDPEEFGRSMAEADPGGRSRALAQAPALIRLTLVLPYTAGYRLAYAEWRDLLEAPPASTEQLLHPERRREAFLAFDLAPLREALPEGCAAVFENGAGELGLSVLLRDLGGAPDPAAWEGWDGDRYLAARCGGERAFAWITAWDSEADAREFEAAYAGIAAAAAARAGLAAPASLRRLGREVHLLAPGLEALAPALPRVPRRRVSTLEALLPRAGAAGHPIPSRFIFL